MELQRFGATAHGVAFFEGNGTDEVDPAAAFTTGPVPDGVVDALKAHDDPPVHAYRGFFRCPRCDDPMAGGFGLWGSAGTGPFEIHLWTDDGRLIVAPHLVVHLIEAHGYQPPPELVAAALAEVGAWHRALRGIIAQDLAQLAGLTEGPGSPDGDDQRRWLLDGLRERLPSTVWFGADPQPLAADDGYLRIGLTPAHAGPVGAPPPAARPLTWFEVERLLAARPEVPGLALRAGVEVRLSRSELLW